MISQNVIRHFRCYFIRESINLLTGKGTITAGEGTIRPGQDFKCSLILFKYKSIVKANLNLMVFIQEIIYLK